MAKAKAQEEQTTNGAAVSNTETISATHNHKDEEGNRTGESTTVSVEIPMPPTTGEAAEVYGEDTVYDLFSRALVIKAQARVRALIEQGKSEDEIRSEMSNFRPDVTRRATKDPLAEARKQVTKMSDEQRQELLALLQG